MSGYDAKVTISFTTDVYNASLLMALYEMLEFDQFDNTEIHEVTGMTESNIPVVLDELIMYMMNVGFEYEELDTRHLEACAERLRDIARKEEERIASLK